MENIEDKIDNAAPTKGYWYDHEFNSSYLGYQYFLEINGIELDGNDNYQVANAVAAGGNPIDFYTDVTLTNGTLTIKASNGIVPKAVLNTGDIIYTQNDFYYYGSESGGGAGIVINSAVIDGIASVVVQGISNSYFFVNSSMAYLNAMVYDTDRFYLVYKLQGEWSFAASRKNTYYSLVPNVFMGHIFPRGGGGATNARMIIGGRGSNDQNEANVLFGWVGQMDIAVFVASDENPLGASSWSEIIVDWTKKFKITIKNLSFLGSTADTNFRAVCVCTKQGNTNDGTSGNATMAEYEATIIEILEA